MNKPILFMIGISLFVAFALTAVSYFYVSKGTQLFCFPSTNQALDEVYAANQDKHGFPKAYYTSAVPSNCSPDEGVGPTTYLDSSASNDANTKEIFNKPALLSDFAVWFVISLGATFGITRLGKKHD